MVEPAKLHRIGPIHVTASSIDAALATMVAAVDTGRARMFAFCNAHTVNLARRDAGLVAALARATTFNDGVGVDIAGRLLHGAPFPANLNGTDLTPMLLAALSAVPRRRIFLLGSAPGVAEKAAADIAARYPGLDIVGIRHGYFTPADSAGMIDTIRQAAPDLVLVGMGQPRQEIWAAEALDRLDTVFLCIGAFLDFCAGAVPRAPGLVRAARLEWLYRLMIEPRRMSGRYLIGNARFLADVMVDRFKARPSSPDPSSPDPS